MTQKTEASGMHKFVLYTYSLAVVAIGWHFLGIGYGDIVAYLKDSSVANAAQRVTEYRLEQREHPADNLNTPEKQVVGSDHSHTESLTDDDRQQLDELLGQL